MPLFLQAILIFTTSFALADARSPFGGSSQNVNFIAAASLPLIGLTKGDDFIGLVDRIDEEREDIRALDIYDLGKTKPSRMDQKFCEEAASRLAGLKDTTQKLKSSEIFKSREGPACLVQIADGERTALIKERAFLIGFIQGKPYAFGARFQKPAKDVDLDNLKIFFKSLK